MSNIIDSVKYAKFYVRYTFINRLIRPIVSEIIKSSFELSYTLNSLFPGSKSILVSILIITSIFVIYLNFKKSKKN